MQSTRRISRVSANALLALLGVALAASSPVMAKQSDRDQPADVTSKSFDGSQQPNGKVIWTGNVVLTQGTLKITGSKATGYLDSDNSIIRVVVDGSPATIHQLDDDNQPMDGKAANIDYKIDQDFAVLTGKAEVHQPVKGSAEGDKLTYNTKDSTMTGESNGGAPVHMTFQPKNKTPGAAPATPAAPDKKKP
ncbi:lipopolysaccharide transport periplasmic protein LptA [Luteibacter sp. UNCMF366Tsu5.1]|uniref:lipopolysaccharide transport periplasmic protein LptA n=1 Tax=Luteibacter sp. UNCMF366Tsu5.1 TaxID=1502758 RepID=UPI000908933D|nr:lipopolysaccharide transport periplasmic protein LptA [Luteibacter sp. UNCMF366Tsu5.1]SFW40060.1 lipopolysaccharide export system protein LptA [Luteibacter sp. UNCMF366Tsu5.1]